MTLKQGGDGGMGKLTSLEQDLGHESLHFLTQHVSRFSSSKLVFQYCRGYFTRGVHQQIKVTKVKKSRVLPLESRLEEKALNIEKHGIFSVHRIAINNFMCLTKPSLDLTRLEKVMNKCVTNKNHLCLSNDPSNHT